MKVQETGKQFLVGGAGGIPVTGYYSYSSDEKFDVYAIDSSQTFLGSTIEEVIEDYKRWLESELEIIRDLEKEE